MSHCLIVVKLSHLPIVISFTPKYSYHDPVIISSSLCCSFYNIIIIVDDLYIWYFCPNLLATRFKAYFFVLQEAALIQSLVRENLRSLYEICSNPRFGYLLICSGSSGLESQQRLGDSMCWPHVTHKLTGWFACGLRTSRSDQCF